MNDPDDSASSDNLLQDRSSTPDMQSEEKPKGNKGVLIVDAVENRIVNIYQPHARPIVRGKDRANVEFGAKPGVSHE